MIGLVGTAYAAIDANLIEVAPVGYPIPGQFSGLDPDPAGVGLRVHRCSRTRETGPGYPHDVESVCSVAVRNWNTAILQRRRPPTHCSRPSKTAGTGESEKARLYIFSCRSTPRGSHILRMMMANGQQQFLKVHRTLFPAAKRRRHQAEG